MMEIVAKICGCVLMLAFTVTIIVALLTATAHLIDKYVDKKPQIAKKGAKTRKKGQK